MIKSFWLTLFFVLAISCLQAQSVNPNLGIIPAPQSIRVNADQFVLSPQTQIIYQEEENLSVAQLLQDHIASKYGFKPALISRSDKSSSSQILLKADRSTNYKAESYQLTIGAKEISISGRQTGLFYGFQTFLQLLPEPEGNVIILPGCEITDSPRYSYRGMHLDVGRHFFPVTFIKKYLDILAQYKLNTFHWHLTDDQGWRIEIKKYPKLTEVGGYRAQTLVGNYHDRMPQIFDGTPYGGFYTQEEVKEVVAYAKARFINVIPEIEMPGHSLAALAAYPELACGDNPGPFRAAEKWGVFEDVYCAGKEQTFRFLEDVLTEVMALFPGKYIHIGGDESPKARWKTCKYCQKRIHDLRLKDEHHLQSYFIQRMEKFLNSKGRSVIGWDEILEGGLAPNATVMSWRSIDGGIAAAKQNHDAIMTPGNFIYFDHVQGKSNQEPLSIGGNTTLEEVYSYNPTPPELSQQAQNRIIGVQANVWTEYMTSPAKVEYMIFPRVYALSEIAWTNPDRKNWADFSAVRVPEHLAKLDKTATLYRVPTAIGIKDTTLLGSTFNIELKPPVKGAKIYYSLDGYNPDETTRLYEKPLNINVPEGIQRVLKTRVITPSGKQSAYTTTYLDHSAPLAPVTVEANSPGLNYYFVPGDFAYTKEIDTLKATEKGQANQFNIAKFRTKARTFGLVYEGYIQIPDDGIYTFSTTSDDGSALWIDERLVVDNDAKHASYSLTGGLNLLKGIHKFQLRYFQAGGSAELKVWMAASNGLRTEIPIGLFMH
ncbi:MAG: family 20 glycosylhydrolase [Sphingobacteriaceae bacterium]